MGLLLVLAVLALAAAASKPPASATPGGVGRAPGTVENIGGSGAGGLGDYVTGGAVSGSEAAPPAAPVELWQVAMAARFEAEARQRTEALRVVEIAPTGRLWVAPPPATQPFDPELAEFLAGELAADIRSRAGFYSRPLCLAFKEAAGLRVRGRANGCYGGQTRAALEYYGVPNPPPAIHGPPTGEYLPPGGRRRHD